MTTDEIKAKAIEAAAIAMHRRDTDPGSVASILELATIAIAAYERAMTRPLADAPPMPAKDRTGLDQTRQG